MDNLVANLFNDFIIEAEDGIKYKNICIQFHTLEKYNISSSYDDFIPVLIIKNKKELINKLEQYIDLVLKIKKLDRNRDNIKKCIYALFANACCEDFSNPTKFIDNHTSFYLNSDFMNEDIKINNITLKKITQSINKSTPYAFKAYIEEQEYRYYLPNIEYGISEDTCYIYSLEQVTKNAPSELSKKVLDRYNPNLLVLTLLLKQLFEYGINKIKVVSYLPMQQYENNADKILDDFNSLNYMFNNIKVLSYPFEQDEYMNICVDEFNINSDTDIELLKKDNNLSVKKTI